MFRIGEGYDCHRFCAGDFIMLGGIKIAHSQGVDAHSDGDVILHAVVDAILGAAALGDIGELFPDTDPTYAGQSSDLFLQEAASRLQHEQYKISNIDITVIAELPKLKPYKLAIRENIASLLNLALEQVSVKAKTNEKLGFLGRQEGIAATASVLIERR